MSPRHGIYRCDPLPPALDWSVSGGRECFYLALFPSGIFVRVLAPADGYDLRSRLANFQDQVFYPSRHRGGHDFRSGRFEGDGTALRLQARISLGGVVYEQRWSLRVAAPHVLVGAGEVYWLAEEF
jgi:hypothetical protein